MGNMRCGDEDGLNELIQDWLIGKHDLVGI